MQFKSKLPYIHSHIFSYMSGLANQYNAINLSQGFPNFEPDAVLKNLVAKCLSENTSQYAPMPGLPLLREEIARKIQCCFNVAVDPDTEVTIGCGATEMIFDTITAFIWPGDEVIIIEPGYDCYRPAIDVVGGVPVVYKMKAPDFSIDWQELAACITPKTRMICISTPNNPTGALMSREDMQELARLTAGTNIIILSDEVYEHMVFDGAVHESPLKYPELRERTVAVYSFGKTLHITGWRIGYAVAPPLLTAELRKVHQNSVFSTPHPLQKAIALYLSESDEYLNLNTLYQQKRDLFRQAMATTKFKPLSCPGSYFQLYDYSAISDEGDLAFCERLVKEYGVAAIPVSRLYTDHQDDRLIRFCFAKTDDVLLAAAKRLELL
ncbi:methionine aminotransferase [Flavobacterium psychrotrophum]|uniref:methionine aminotransferase n=1 Tax=Flavobacterium psychrotrophum TaxID=2294119 RepID=UPI000E313027|nr:methionine aminotransferase [Flavobacterium psychrotrophum]